MNSTKMHLLKPNSFFSGIFLSLIIGFSINVSHAEISQSPLFLTISVDPNILFNMSIETPMGGAAYNDQADTDSGCAGRVNVGGQVGNCYFKTKSYFGYFDPDKCYVYNSTDGRFDPDSNTLNSDHECSGKFSGNFMNWATMTAMDMFVWTMTGGNRIVDSADNTTVVRRMRKTNNDNWFPHKLITNTGAAARRNVAPSTVTPWNDNEIFIANTDFGVKFGTSRNGNEKGTMNVNIRVCNKNKALEDNCVAYTDGDYYKPEGLIQKNADHMRFGVTSFTNTNGNGIDGGVLRSNMKYIGSLKPDGSGGTTSNTNAEINTDGTIVLNSNPDDATASGVTQSGVMPYLNKFSDSGYKGNDPASELFYESIRYFKNLGPTAEYLTGANGGFPILGAASWVDPIQQRCQKNFIIGINDANPWMDKKLPGTFFTSDTFNGHDISGDYGQPSTPDSAINVTALTNTVGDLQGLTGTSQCIGCTATSCDLNANNKTIAGLGEVFGTCPSPQKENSYYIAGLAYYANTQDIRTGASGTTDFSGKQTITTFMVDTQEFNNNPLLGQMNMLWLAGKYGGFNDFNNNGRPDGQVLNTSGDVVTPSEWDTDGNGEPDNYVLATNPEKLVTALNAAFSEIDKRSSSASAVAANSTQLNTGTQVYQAKFDSTDWSGKLQAFAVDFEGVLTSAWEASTLLPAPADRNIFTFNPLATEAPYGVEFLWGNLSTTPTGTSQQDYLNTLSSVNDSLGESRLNWLRGIQTNEQSSSNPNGFRKRTNILGDIVNSDPIFVGTEDLGYSILPTVGASYAAYVDSKAAKRPMLYLGANDGMLHGFDAQPNGGQEIFAYIPNALYPELSKLTSPAYAHQYFVDGMSATGDAHNGTAWRTLLAGTTGAGGRAVFALDVSNPDNFSASDVLWEFTNANDADLGYTLAQPAIVRMEDGHWATIIANGYNSDNGHAVLFVLDAFTGAVLQKLDTGVGSTTDKNGLSSPLAVDTNNDRSIDTIYAGDLYGNLWKFDVSGVSGSWPVPSSPFFVACTTTGSTCSRENRQAITAKPNVGPAGGTSTGQSSAGVMVYFGTGKYFESNDNIVGGSPQTQTFYGLWDTGSAITDRANLQEQTITFEGFAPTSCETETCPDTTDPIRVVSNNAVCYSLTSPGCASSPLKSGWALNLVSPVNNAEGERAISFPLLRRGLVVFATIVPSLDPCSAGGRSWLMEVDAFGGGEFSGAPFDVNGDGVVDASDMVIIDGVAHAASGIDQQIGITKTPAVIEAASVDFKYSSGSSGSMGTVTDYSTGGSSGPNGIRRSWQQLR